MTLQADVHYPLSRTLCRKYQLILTRIRDKKHFENVTDRQTDRRSRQWTVPVVNGRKRHWISLCQTRCLVQPERRQCRGDRPV